MALTKVDIISRNKIDIENIIFFLNVAIEEKLR